MLGRLEAERQFGPVNASTVAVEGTTRSVVIDYSACARRALKEAGRRASSTPDCTMTCEHLLIAIASDEECAAARVLSTLGLDHEALDRRIRFILGPEPEAADGREATISPRAERVLMAAGDEARRRHAKRVDTLHLLVALVRERRGVAVLALEAPGLGLEPIGGAIMRAFREGFADPA
jgi:ATP-dependent Clp protease ATP-binding subunit ClpC